MNSTAFAHPSFKQLIAVLFCLLSSIWPAQAQVAKPANRLSTPEQRAARYFESIRRSPPQMTARPEQGERKAQEAEEPVGGGGHARGVTLPRLTFPVWIDG